MEILDDTKAELRKTHGLAKKFYDSGEIAKSRNKYMKCSRLSKQISKLSSKRVDRKNYLQKAKKFEEIATGLKEGNIKIHTDGVKPAEPLSQKESQDGNDDIADKVRELILAEKPKIRFNDIAGLDNVKEQIRETIVYPFNHPEAYQYYDVAKGGGILLYGPPGCGKTMLAAAAAAECDATFISLKISDIKDKYVGESEKKIKEVFNLAREYEKAIIFFDEMDALATDRSDSGQGHEKSLVNELLAQMDGVDTKGSNQYLLLAATNLPWAIDSAIRRPGRFNKSIFIPQPDFAARKKLFQIYLKKKPVSKRLNIDELARNTEGFASAEIRQVCEDAAIIPLREVIKGKAKREISGKDFEQAISDMQTILASWYMKATRELKKNGEEDTFSDLMNAGEMYS